ncbi:MAG: hypothetical protein HC795_13850 [Coleofasciculaceae cyanobacterium RL_1_1]|nr:hypothetical protein [Coleofasciculaceae cyanobacterium RL_1_1]
MLTSLADNGVLEQWSLPAIEQLQPISDACNWLEDYLTLQAPPSDRELCDELMPPS